MRRPRLTEKRLLELHRLLTMAHVASEQTGWSLEEMRVSAACEYIASLKRWALWRKLGGAQ